MSIKRDHNEIEDEYTVQEQQFKRFEGKYTIL